LAELEGGMQTLQQEMSTRAVELSNLVGINPHPSLFEVIPPETYNGDWVRRFAVCRYYEMKIPNQRKLEVDVYLAPDGWRIFAFRRPNGDPGDERLLEAKGFKSMIDDDWFPNLRLCFRFG